jgi:hypothetical protein
MPHFSLSGSTRDRTPACRIHSSAREGSGAASSFFISDQTRSAESRSSPSFSRAGLQPFGVGPTVAIPGEEAEEAQDAQIILTDAGFGVADEAQPPRLDVRQPADEIDHRAVRFGVEPVDGEVAPAGIRRPVAAERHLGMAAVRLDVCAQRRHLEGASVDHRRHCAVLDAGGHSLEASRLHPPHGLVRQRRGGDVDIGHRLVEQRVAHRTARNPGQFAVGRKRRKELLQVPVVQPVAPACDRNRSDH